MPDSSQNSQNTQSIPLSRFQELLLKAKKLAAARKEEDSEAAINSLEEVITTNSPTHVNLTNLSISPESLKTAEGREAAVEVIGDVAAGPPKSFYQTSQKRHTTGVAAAVELNSQQQLFIETALKGEDVCLIGAAGTGKTTGTGRFIKELQSSGALQELGADTKWLRAAVPGVLITSFTRKAVNNIRRAIPEELRPHVLTMHKVLEFAPIFYDTFDEKSGSVRKTMKFEPQRTAYNPLPSGLSLVVYEESSMIGTDLYNLMSAAMPHNPQEIFIGDIRQLPPIFGPAILGFKMSLLPVVELTDVYRQALLSPIIRLAHAVLSGDSTRFSPAVIERTETHEHLPGKPKVKRKVVPSLEKFNEDDPEYGSVKIQIWQKKLPELIATSTTVLQFQAWERSGYYNPNEDIILCPFNKSFGTVELNKGIQNYLGLKRGAVVHEVIAGFQKHYLAIGDRVLFDKEDAVITDIRRNLTYMGTSPQPASPHLDRWGTYQEQLSEKELLDAQKENVEAEDVAMERFLNSFSEDGEENRVNAASHVVTIQFTYSEETMNLAQAGEVNSLLGGNAITVHKMQGSEAEAIFLVLHHSHAAMLQNELLYTAITRARKKLHVICEVDTFFKGVKSHKVRGVTLADKIDFFKGKVEYKEMQEEMAFLNRQREAKKARLEAACGRALSIAASPETEKLVEEEEVEKEEEKEVTEVTKVPQTLADKLRALNALRK